MVTHQKEVYYRFGIWHLDLTKKLTPGDNYQGWSLEVNGSYFVMLLLRSQSDNSHSVKGRRGEILKSLFREGVKNTFMGGSLKLAFEGREPLTPPKIS